MQYNYFADFANVFIVYLTWAELYWKGGGSGGPPPENFCILKLVRNKVILNISNEFIGLHIEVHSGFTIRGTDCIVATLNVKTTFNVKIFNTKGKYLHKGRFFCI